MIDESTVGRIWHHDCDDCISLGPFGDKDGTRYDLYYCPEGNMGTPTVVARYGNDGPEYTSGIHIAKSGLSPVLSEALHRTELLNELEES